MKRAIFSKAAGWALSAIGGAHVVVASFDTRSTWRQVAAEGWWNTFTLDLAVSAEELRRSETFWATAGSFGVPLLALGGYILRSTQRGDRVPAWLGWMLLIYGTICGIMLPKSPIWVIAVAGLLVVLDSRHSGRLPREESELATATSGAKR